MPAAARATQGSAASSSTQTAANKASAEELSSGNVTVNAVPANALSVNSASAWNAAINKIRNGGDNQDYVIHVTGTVTVPAISANENLFGDVVGISVTIQGGGTLAMSNTFGSLIRISRRQEVVVRNVTLRGHSNNNSMIITILREGTLSMEGGSYIMGNKGGGIRIDGGTFIMQEGTITGNTWDGGVRVDGGGIFTMQGGTISGNKAQSDSAGVFVFHGTFTMKGGTISDNRAGGGGGGVYVYNGTFAMQGGTISGNEASYGGGVYIDRSGTLIKTGGIIYGNDASIRERNTKFTSSYQGHAILWDSRWRNATAGPDDRTDGYGFWLND
jgi:hypothetical protein